LLTFLQFSFLFSLQERSIWSKEVEKGIRLGTNPF
jgi:hypothetical protein